MTQAGDSASVDIDLTNCENIPETGIQNDFDLVSLASTHDSIMLYDDQNVEEVQSFTHGSVTLTARKDDEAMEEPEEAVVETAMEVKVEEEEKKYAGRLTEKKKAKPIPDRPLDVTPVDQADEKLALASEKAEDRAWLDPTDLSFRIPFRNVNNNGRLLQISKKLSYFLRGHPLEYNLPCPELNFLDMSVEWEELMKFTRRKIWELEDWEVLQVVRSSDTRRFQIQVAP